MLISDNNWPVLSDNSSMVHDWVIPAKTGTVVIPARYGCAGYTLAHFALWYAETIESLAKSKGDDFGFSRRPIAGTNVWSNHASGTAMDLNSASHAYGVRGTLLFLVRGVPALLRIKSRLLMYRGCLRHGAFYTRTVDDMHVEINKPIADVNELALRLMKTPRGKRLLAANPGQKRIIEF